MLPSGQHLTPSRHQARKVKATENFVAVVFKRVPEKMEPPGCPGPRPPREIVIPFGPCRFSEPLQAAS